mgnify:CR=1 FL=1
MFLSTPDLQAPGELTGTDALNGYSSGGYSNYGDIADAVMDDAKLNNSMFGMHLAFQEKYKENAAKVFKLTQERLPEFDAMRYKDIAKSLTAGKKLGDEQLSDYTADLDLIEEKLKRIRKNHPEVGTFASIFDDLKAEASTKDVRAQTQLARADATGDVVGFMAGMAGSFTSADPLNIASLAVGGWGASAPRRIISEAGIGGLSEAINQFLGIRENRKLLGLKTSAWQTAQQILFAGAGAGAVRGALEGVPALARVGEQKFNPGKAVGREMLAALEEVGVPVNNPKFMDGVARELAQGTGSTARGAQYVVEDSTRFNNSNPFGDTSTGRDQHHKLASDAIAEYNKANVDFDEGINTLAKTNVLDEILTRGNYTVGEVIEVQNRASAEVDGKLETNADEARLLENRITAIEERVETLKTTPMAELLKDVSPVRAAEFAEIEARKADTSLNKSARKKLAKQEQELRESGVGQAALQKRLKDIDSLEAAIPLVKKELKKLGRQGRELKLERTRVRENAQRDLNLKPHPKLPDEAFTPSERTEGFSKRPDTEATVERLEKSDVELPKRVESELARIKASYDAETNTFDIGNARVDGDMMIDMDDGPSVKFSDMLDDLESDDALLKATRECVL